MTATLKYSRPSSEAKKLNALASERARLKISRKGDLASHVSERIPDPVGKHWTAGRDVAALAALAGEAGP